MSLLSFRTPVLYAACHRCGNALTHGEEECPHCGTNQSRALRALNSVDFSNNVITMPGRMLVPYPSVPEEVDTAMNIAPATRPGSKARGVLPGKRRAPCHRARTGLCAGAEVARGATAFGTA